METKRVEAITLKADTHGTFEALIATFDKVDKHGDVVRRGAFADTITAWRARGGKVPVVFSHRSEDITQHVGECAPDDLIETDRGFQVRGQFYLDEPIAQKVFAQLRRKALTEWSFGFLIARAKPRPGGGRELLALDLVELGPTLKGAGDTATISVKRQAPAPGPLDAYRWQIDRAVRRNAIARARARP